MMEFFHLLLPLALFLSSPEIFINRNKNIGHCEQPFIRLAFLCVVHKKSHSYSFAIFVASVVAVQSQSRHCNIFNYQNNASEAQQTWKKNGFIFWYLNIFCLRL